MEMVIAMVMRILDVVLQWKICYSLTKNLLLQSGQICKIFILIETFRKNLLFKPLISIYFNDKNFQLNLLFNRVQLIIIIIIKILSFICAVYYFHFTFTIRCSWWWCFKGWCDFCYLVIVINRFYLILFFFKYVHTL